MFAVRIQQIFFGLLGVFLILLVPLLRGFEAEDWAERETALIGPQPQLEDVESFDERAHTADAEEVFLIGQAAYDEQFVLRRWDRLIFFKHARVLPFYGLSAGPDDPPAGLLISVRPKAEVAGMDFSAAFETLGQGPRGAIVTVTGTLDSDLEMTAQAFGHLRKAGTPVRYAPVVIEPWLDGRAAGIAAWKAPDLWFRLSTAMLLAGLACFAGVFAVGYNARQTKRTLQAAQLSHHLKKQNKRLLRK